MFPRELDEYIKGLEYRKDIIGCSEDEVYLFEDKFVLKISSDKNRLLREKNKTDWLNSITFSCAKSICYIEKENKYYYLRTYIKGESLLSERFLNNPMLLIKILMQAISKLRSLDNANCPFTSEDNKGQSFIHGDLCLPNIFVDENNNFVGFIDLENAGVGDIWYDYSWLLWSLKHNLKTDKYNKILLKKLNIDFNEEKYNQYIHKSDK